MTYMHNEVKSCAEIYALQSINGYIGSRLDQVIRTVSLFVLH